MYKRYILNNVKEALSDTPVVFIMGPRQVGKTTLAQNFIDDSWEYITLDDQSQFNIIKNDPVGFIRNLSKPKVVIDEVQRLPELFVSIKQSVDENKAPGRFLLTGSANALLLPKLSDSLAGRIESIPLMTLSECEIKNTKPTFLQKLLSQVAPVTKEIRIRDYLLDRLVTGCFPVVLSRKNESRVHSWYKNYVGTLIQRDVHDISDIRHPELMTKLMSVIMYHSGKLINFSEIGNKVKLDSTTVKKYIALLEQLFLVKKLPAWHTSEYKRLIKMPKIHAIDTGMMCALRGINKQKLIKSPVDIGPLLETFVYNELCKQAVFIDEPLYFYHYRDKNQVEIDIIIETSSGDYIAIEIKSSASLGSNDFLGLKKFKEITKEKFKFGVLLYDGDHTSAFGDNLFAVPIAALWSE